MSVVRNLLAQGDVYLGKNVYLNYEDPRTITNIKGDTQLQKKLTVLGNTQLNTLNVSQSANLENTLDVGLKTTLNDELNVKKDTLLEQDLTVLGNTSFGGQIDITGNANIAVLTVNNTSTFKDDVKLEKDINIDGSVDISTGLNVEGEARVVGNSYFNNDVQVGGNLTVLGDMVTKTSRELIVGDSNITLNSGFTDNSNPGTGIISTIRSLGYTTILQMNSITNKIIFSVTNTPPEIEDPNFISNDFLNFLSVGNLIQVSGCDQSNDGVYIVEQIDNDGIIISQDLTNFNDVDTTADFVSYNVDLSEDFTETQEMNRPTISLVYLGHVRISYKDSRGVVEYGHGSSINTVTKYQDLLKSSFELTYNEIDISSVQSGTTIYTLPVFVNRYYGSTTDFNVYLVPCGNGLSTKIINDTNYNMNVHVNDSNIESIEGEDYIEIPSNCHITLTGYGTSKWAIM
jgi:cytoskeletal protein CcmA (bactofilin family)